MLDRVLGDVSKIFDTAEFGFREIRVERPLRLNFQASEERIARLEEAKVFIKLKEKEKEAIKNALNSLPDTLYKNRPEFEDVLAPALQATGLKIGAPLKKVIMTDLSERDKKADICTDKNGNPEPDSDLRDHELVPLKEDWKEYVKREVTPFVPDAWVDKSYTDDTDGKVGRVGYEINFNRYFYKYVPLRPLEVIDEELKQLELEIAHLLKEVSG